jgi:hypothetical protein
MDVQMCLKPAEIILATMRRSCSPPAAALLAAVEVLRQTGFRAMRGLICIKEGGSCYSSCCSDGVMVTQQSDYFTPKIKNP